MTKNTRTGDSIADLTSINESRVVDFHSAQQENNAVDNRIFIASTLWVKTKKILVQVSSFKYISLSRAYSAQLLRAASFSSLQESFCALQVASQDSPSLHNKQLSSNQQTTFLPFRRNE